MKKLRALLRRRNGSITPTGSRESAGLPDSYTVPPYISTAPTSRLVAERALVDRALFVISTTLPIDRVAQASALRCLAVLDAELIAREC
jgi:hypothetical protein